MRKKIGIALSLVLVVALFLGGCTSSTKPQEGPEEPVEERKVGGTITYGMTGDPVIFNPILYTDTPSGFVISRVYSGLVQPNENLEMIPDIAESWTFSEDGLV